MKRRRQDCIGRFLTARPRFFLGVFMLVPLFLVDDLKLKAVDVFLYAILAVFSGKRIRWLYFISLILSVTLFHLITPWGRVLFRVGSVAVTSGSLETGMKKGLTLVGIVFISVASVRPELRFPGRLGHLMARCLCYFEAILNERKFLVNGLTIKNLFLRLDKFLLELFNPEKEFFGYQMETGRVRSNGNVWGMALAVLVASVPWLLWLVSGML